jgi:membrane protein involved in colicin uptake
VRIAVRADTSRLNIHTDNRKGSGPSAKARARGNREIDGYGSVCLFHVRIHVLTIAPDGTVKSTRIVGGHPVLAAAAESAALKSTFQPGPKETIEVLEFRFSGK